MITASSEPVCPVLRKLCVLLESEREPAGNGQRSAFRARLAEIELDALLLDAAPGTRVLIQVAREVTTFADEIAARVVGRRLSD